MSIRVKNFDEAVAKWVREDVRRRLKSESLPADPYDFDAVTDVLRSLEREAARFMHPDTSKKVERICREDYEMKWGYALRQYRRTLRRCPDAAATHRNKNADDGDQLRLL